MDSLAEFMSAAWAAIHMPGSFPWLLFYMHDAADGDVKALSADLDAGLDRVKLMEMGNSCWNFDLTRAQASVTVPTLYLEQRMPRHAELREAFLRFVPHAEVKQLAIWPTRLEDEECGRDLSRRAIKFIQKHSAEADARTD